MPAFRIICSILGAIILTSIASERPRASPVGAGVIGFFAGLIAAVLAENVWRWLFLPADKKKEAAKDVAKAVGILTAGFIIQAIFSLVFFGGISLLLMALFGW